MLTRVLSGALLGIDAYLVEVEVDFAGGLPGYQLVGLPATATVEGKVRIRAALANSGLKIPPRKISVNLAPADVRKDGAAFDLPVAVGIVAAAGLMPGQRLPDYLLVGELSLSGDIKPVRGVLPLAQLARGRRLQGIIVPRANAAEAALVHGVAVHGARSLGEVVAFLAGARDLEAHPARAPLPGREATGHDFAEVRGQPEAKQAMEIAAAGGHNVLLVGEPGCGKTMLARRLPSILPDLTLEEALEVTKIHSVAGTLGATALVTMRPFRAPHHSLSGAGLVGGGSSIRPGEVSLAHHGVLFLDELPEFARGARESLRQPLEDGEVTLVRARQRVTFPAAFTLVAAANPCPCGYAGSTVRSCVCSTQQLTRYRLRLSGPLLDRIDLHVPVRPVAFDDLVAEPQAESSQTIRARVAKARARQQERLAPYGAPCNAAMSGALTERFSRLDALGTEVLGRAVRRYGLSARAVSRVRKVACTVADLRGSDEVTAGDLVSALRYRVIDPTELEPAWAPPATATSGRA